jgi:hypothetical protein
MCSNQTVISLRAWKTGVATSAFDFSARRHGITYTNLLELDPLLFAPRQRQMFWYDIRFTLAALLQPTPDSTLSARHQGMDRLRSRDILAHPRTFCKLETETLTTTTTRARSHYLF